MSFDLDRALNVDGGKCVVKRNSDSRTFNARIVCTDFKGREGTNVLCAIRGALRKNLDMVEVFDSYGIHPGCDYSMHNLPKTLKRYAVLCEGNMSKKVEARFGSNPSSAIRRAHGRKILATKEIEFTEGEFDFSVLCDDDIDSPF